MTTRSRYESGILTFFDDIANYERVAPVAPVVFYDDFLKNAIDVGWTSIDVSAGGNTTPIQAGAANGVARLPLDVTSEAQESGLTWGDKRSLVLNQGLIFECRVALQTLPTLLGIAVWGVAGNKNAVADTVAESAWFRVDGNGVVTVETDDTVHEQTTIATGTTLTAGLFATFRIDCRTITDVQFFINGARVAAATTFNMSQVAGLLLQPYFHIAKASGAGLGVVDVDFCRAWMRRAA